MAAPAARQRGFFDFSFPELVITFGVALVVLGPKKLPGLVQQIGRWVGRARHMARQFREQLESEVNSINAVKPEPMKPAPDVGPVQPSPEATASSAVHDAASGTEATGVVDSGTPEASVAASEAVPEPPAEQTHPEAQIYFAMNGGQPDVVAYNPHDVPPPSEEPQATPEEAVVTEARAEEPKQPATVEVIFPHDHG